MTSSQSYKQLTDLEHIKARSTFYLGSKELIKSPDYVFTQDYKSIEFREIESSPALVKCVDELVVNALDENAKGNIGDILFTTSVDNGLFIFSVENKNAKFNLYKTKNSLGKEMWSAQLAWGEFRASGNFDSDGGSETENSITGGMYGFGSKGTNAMSKKFSAEVYDAVNKIWYYQEWLDGMNSVSEPEIEYSPSDLEGQIGYVRITSSLQINEFGGATDQKFLDGSFKLINIRLTQTAAVCHGRSKVFLNSIEQKYTFQDLCSMISQSPGLIKFDMIGFGPRRLRWELYIGRRAANDLSKQYFTIVNGIYIRYGSHIEFVQNQIVEYIKPLWINLKDPSIKKPRAVPATGKKAKPVKPVVVATPVGIRFQKSYILKYLFIGIMASIPGLKPTGARKDGIAEPDTKYRDYIIPKARLEEIWMQIKPLIEMDIFNKNNDEGKRSKATKALTKAPKYKHAKWAISGGPHAKETRLVISEGDTADGLIQKIIAFRQDWNKRGTFIMGGVPVNPRKEISQITHPVTGELLWEKSKKLKEYERYITLVAVLMLSYDCEYTNIEDIRMLPYGGVEIATDQDEDGQGNIRSQIFNFFWTFWPALVKTGYIKFIVTPIIRSFHPRKFVEEFYTEKTFKEWEAKTLDSNEYDHEYYKGLGSHSDDEARQMAQEYEKHVVTYLTDENTEAACEVYFGKDADSRKAVLIYVPKYTEEDYITPAQTISATHHLNTATRKFQIYNIGRHSPNAIDRFVPSYRKILAGSRRSGLKRIKVYMLGGDVAKKMNYHHGDASLSGAIISCAQTYPGALEFPVLLPLSQFGSRKFGGDDAGSPRYIFTKYNKHLMDAIFPRIDDYILDYTWDDGKMGEPVFYVPVIPLAILENYQGPSHGWACNTWGRNYWEVADFLHKCIDSGVKDSVALKIDDDFSFTKNRFKHVFLNKTTVVGTYVKNIENNTITITELPVRIWNSKITEKADDISEIQCYTDRSIDDKIDIEIKFIDGYLTKLFAQEHKDDPIIKMLGMKQSLKPNLNMIVQGGSIKEFKSYKEIFDYWYVIRYEYYGKRIERMTLLIELKLMLLNEKLKFISRREKIKISGLKRNEQVVLLEKEKFIKINHNLLEKPMYITVADMRPQILDGKKSNHEYLRNMNADDLSDEGKLDLEQEMKKLNEDLMVFKAPGAIFNLWKKELIILDKIVKVGQTHPCGWLAWEPKKNWKFPTTKGTDFTTLPTSDGIDINPNDIKEDLSDDDD